MLVQCPHCSKTLKVPDTVAGKKIRCPACSGVVSVPLVASALSQGAASPRTEPTEAGKKGESTAPPIRKARAVGPVSSENSERPSRQNRPASRPRRRPAPEDVEESFDENDDGGSFEAEGPDYFASNPFAPPRSAAGASSARSGGQGEVSSRRLAGLGLLIQGWATVYIFLSLVFIVVASYIAEATGRGGAGSQGF